MKKWKFFTNLKKEEEWINAIQASGYRLTKVPIPQARYHFELFNPQHVETVRIDFREAMTKNDYQDYLTLFEDGGWEWIGGCSSSGSQYFRKLPHTHDDILFSDDESQLAFYKRYRKSTLWTAWLFLCYSLIHFTTVRDFLVPFQNPKALFLTPGLWELNGMQFWLSFLFELPFALLRGGILFYLCLATVLFYLYVAYQAKPKQ